MSTSHRWVRIKTLEEMMKLLEINNVVIAEVVSDIFKLSAPNDAESFIDFFNYYNGGKDLRVSIIDPKSYRNYKNTKFLASTDPHHYATWVVLTEHILTKGKYPYLRGSFWDSSRLLIHNRFNMSNFNGFYVLEEVRLCTSFNSIETPEDIPEDGIVYNLGNVARKIFEHPKGRYNIFKEDTYEELVKGLVFDKVQNQYKVREDRGTWVPLTYDLSNEKSLDDVIAHLRETFVSTSGITPDEFYDEVNKDVL